VLSRTEERLVVGLGRRRRREEERLFIAEGVRVVEELLAAGVRTRFVVTSPTLEETERGAALARRLPDSTVVRQVTAAELDRLARTQSPQGVLAVAEMASPRLADLRPTGPALALVLDGVQDPGNIGTLARTAVAFGCHLLVCLRGTVDPWNAKAVRASAGALFRLPVWTSDDAEAWEWLATHGFVALGADAAGVPVRRRPESRRSALVVGNEGAGLTPGARSRCDTFVGVPMRPGSESLNVAVAAGILLYELSGRGE
jgi:RNA methyltransferase, TrmH family